MSVSKTFSFPDLKIKRSLPIKKRKRFLFPQEGEAQQDELISLKKPKALNLEDRDDKRKKKKDMRKRKAARRPRLPESGRQLMKLAQMICVSPPLHMASKRASTLDLEALRIDREKVRGRLEEVLSEAEMARARGEGLPVRAMDGDLRVYELKLVFVNGDGDLLLLGDGWRRFARDNIVDAGVDVFNIWVFHVRREEQFVEPWLAISIRTWFD